MADLTSLPENLPHPTDDGACDHLLGLELPEVQLPSTRGGAGCVHSEGWTALSQSSEMAAYRPALSEGKQICDGFQARLDATAAAGAFADTPWIPS